MKILLFAIFFLSKISSNNMGKSVNRKDSSTDDNYSQLMSPDGVQTSALDLSMKKEGFFHPQRSITPPHSFTKTTLTYGRQMSMEDLLESPRVITEPKREWHYRSLKDLQKKHLPYLAGIGPQRTPVRVSICEKLPQQIYLRVAIKTVDNDDHPSKVIVPAKTYVSAEYLLHDNNLDCLRFDQCNPSDCFDSDERCMYLAITPAEHQAGYKEVRVHMFNLYQNHALTKEMILSQQLHLCILAFSLCIYQNDRYVPVSDTSYSSIIEEKKMTTRSRIPTQIYQPMSTSDPRSQFMIDCETDEENSY